MRIFKSAHFALVCLVWFGLVRFGPEIPRKDNRVPDIENSIENRTSAHIHAHQNHSCVTFSAIVPFFPFISFILVIVGINVINVELM